MYNVYVFLFVFIKCVITVSHSEEKRGFGKVAESSRFVLSKANLSLLVLSLMD